MKLTVLFESLAVYEYSAQLAKTFVGALSRNLCVLLGHPLEAAFMVATSTYVHKARACLPLYFT